MRTRQPWLRVPRRAFVCTAQRSEVEAVELFDELAREHCPGSIIAAGQFATGGLGWRLANEQPSHSDTGEARKLLRVPLRVCLSAEVPGCSPPAHASPALEAVWGSDEPWEVKLAAALLWATRRRDAASGGPSAVGHRAGRGVASPATAFFDFWRRYAPLLPSAQDLTTLLFLNPHQLSELQDPDLAAEGRAWQEAVVGAYDRWIDAPAFRAEARDASLADWLAAVGAVESRAFGFRARDGSEIRAYVPFFCCANHSPSAPTMHLLSLEPPEMEAEAAAAAEPAGPGPQRHGSPGSPSQGWEPSADMVALRLAPEEEGQLFIDYGKKDTRALVSQYGFVLYGNPYDRLDWGGGRHGPMRREWVHAAAERLAAALEAQTEELAAGPKQGLDPGQPGGAAAPTQPWPGGAAAACVRLRSAAASIVSACGWRSLKERRDVTPATELAAITSLTRWAKRELQSFPTSPEYDQALLDSELGERGLACNPKDCAGALKGKSGQAFTVGHRADGRLAEAAGQCSSRLRLAIEYRLERKLLLRAALELLEELRRELVVAGQGAG